MSGFMICKVNLKVPILLINSLAPGRCGRIFKTMTFKFIKKNSGYGSAVKSWSQFIPSDTSAAAEPDQKHIPWFPEVA